PKPIASAPVEDGVGRDHDGLRGAPGDGLGALKDRIREEQAPRARSPVSGDLAPGRSREDQRPVVSLFQLRHEATVRVAPRRHPAHASGHRRERAARIGALGAGWLGAARREPQPSQEHEPGEDQAAPGAVPAPGARLLDGTAPIGAVGGDPLLLVTQCPRVRILADPPRGSLLFRPSSRRSAPPQRPQRGPTTLAARRRALLTPPRQRPSPDGERFSLHPAASLAGWRSLLISTPRRSLARRARPKR